MQRMDEARWSTVQAAMRANGGHVLAAQVAELCGCTHQAADTYLRRLRALGMVELTRIGMGGGGALSFWHAPGHVVAVRSARQEMVDLLAAGGKTRPEICKALGKTLTGANTLLNRMRHEGAVEVRGRGVNAVWYLAGQAPRETVAPAVKPAAVVRHVVPVVVPAGLRIQRGPSWTHDKRFQLHPDARAQFRGEFSKLGPGRYLAKEATT